MKDTICSSADKVLEEFLRTLSTETSHHRMVVQENKCGYGLSGVCCRLCANGPCRLSPSKPRGVCGADADTIAVRNFLRSVAAGSGCYIHVVENTAKRLKEMAVSNGKIKGEATLFSLCAKLGITGADAKEKAIALADAVLEDLRRPIEEKMKLLEKLTIPARLQVWQKYGLFPGGAKDEIFNAVVKTSTNLNSDPMDMLVQCLRLGISTGLYGLVLTNLLNDIVIGEPEIVYEPVGMRVIDPANINIMLTGHQQAMYRSLIDVLNSPQAKLLAESVGAKGIKIVGCTCVGQDFQTRSAACGSSFCGHAGNNYTSEAVLLTGCIDAVVSEFNCTIPGVEPICEELEIPNICLDDVAKKKNAALLSYSDEKKDEISIQIIATAVEAYKKRKNILQAKKMIEAFSKNPESPLYASLQQEIFKKGIEEAVRKQTDKLPRENPMCEHGQTEAIAGLTEVTLKKALGGSYQSLIDVIASGKIKGIAAVVGCSNLRAKGHDIFTVEMTKGLIAKDILVVSAGCTCGGLENCGLMSKKAKELAGPGLRELCEVLQIPPVLNFGPCLAIGRIEAVAAELAQMLNVDIPKLPVVVSAPQWLEEQALADGAFALAMGFPLHLGLAPFMTGSQTAVQVLTEGLKEITGGYLFVETEIAAAVEKIEKIILEKRCGLGL